ncbi:MAG: potassium transporter Kup [Rhodospirillaceae bacterium]|nr:MAG: potassium transporter Kup [Rhodospirillaceae bacterium]
MSNDVGPGATGPSSAAAAQPALTLADRLPGRPHGSRRDRGDRNLTMLAIGALGIVYGDVGTSPIYTLRETFGATGHVMLTPDNILGVLSLIFWALLIVVSGKYVSLILRADNHGEGGVMALTALVLGGLGPERRRRRVFLFMGLLGAALFYGDSVITPAISVLSAVEGLEVATPILKSYVVPISVAVLVFLFMIQGAGTARVGALFGPIMVLWFLTLGVLGLFGIAANPAVLAAVDPREAYTFCMNHGGLKLLAPLGAIVLALTGAEAIYADMGHFGRKPIQQAWFALVMPALLLNYFGQGALIMAHPATVSAPFFLLAPNWLLYPLVGLSTLATIIASQAVISGTFSMTHQALLLGFLPRLPFRHTSATEYGQIYMPHVNWILMLAVVGLVLGFKTSSNLASAYGIAVTGTMLIATGLLYSVATQSWGWSWAKMMPIFMTLAVIDLSFFSSCMTKVVDGGWFPLLVAGGVFAVFQAWREGRAELTRSREDASLSLESFIARLSAKKVPRVAGTAVFMTSSLEGVPSALLHNLKHNKVLHERVVLLTVLTEQVPWVADAERLAVSTYPHAFYRVVARYGFMESPDVPAALTGCACQGLAVDMMDTSFFLGRDSLVPKLRSSLPVWRERVFLWLWRNAASATDFFRLPPNRVVEMGSQTEI